MWSEAYSPATSIDDVLDAQLRDSEECCFVAVMRTFDASAALCCEYLKELHDDYLCHAARGVETQVRFELPTRRKSTGKLDASRNDNDMKPPGAADKPPQRLAVVPGLLHVLLQLPVHVLLMRT